jgi:16S rRNA (cytosine1402-N4)-methyltransferase
MSTQSDFGAADRHVPVLVEPVLSVLGDCHRVLDCTLGMGGHSLQLLQRGCQVVGVDRDPQARQLAVGRLRQHSGFSVRAGAFSGIAADAVQSGECFDGVLADLGVSSLQLDADERGFGIRSEAELDLRMDPEHGEPAHALIARLDNTALADLLYQFGEERRSRRIAPALRQAVVNGCRSGRELAEVIRAVVPGRHKRHPALRSFQALRIAVNDELGELERLLAVLPRLLSPGGKAVVISFHSLEDRLVKQAFRASLQAGEYAAISRKVVVADPAELAANPRAHSAKLRWCEVTAELSSTSGGNE